MVMLVGCGRIGFDAATTSGDAGGITEDGASGDGASGEITATFGETGVETFSGVTADTSVSNAGPANDNYGATTYMLVQSASAAVSLIRFDLSAIPSTATVSSASLRLYMVGGSAGGVTAYAMLEAWQEGTQDGQTGVASYNERLPGTAWASPGAGVASRASVSAGGGAFVDTATPCDVVIDQNVVQGWVATSITNNGLALLGTSINTDVATRENPTLSIRPVLTVTYTN